MCIRDRSGGGPIALLGDKLRHAGVLPSLPGGGARAARLTSLEGGRTNELADVVLEDPALAFELLRLVNSAQVRGTQVAGSGPVLTVRRAIAMVGMDGVRHAATALGLSDCGRLAPGLRADLAIWDAGHPAELSYRIGATPLHARIFGGRLDA